MNLSNKTFKNNKTGDLVKVIDSFENIAILENREKIEVRRLLNPELFTEQIDPKNFFSNQTAYNLLAEKIKNIPASQIRDEEETVQVNEQFGNVNTIVPSTNDSAIIMTTEEDERAELARKYGVNPNTTKSVAKQNEAFAKLLGDDATELPVVNTQQVQINDTEVIQRIEVERDLPVEPITTKVETKVEDPIITMFKKTKRNVDFNISFEVSNKIPRLDFIEMMEDSYEISIIDFLAEQFTTDLINNPESLKTRIKDKISELVYGNKSTPEPKVEIAKTNRKPKPKTNKEEKLLVKTKKEKTEND